MNTLEFIREKLRDYNEGIIDKVLLEKILSKFAPNYSVTQLCSLGLISPLKRGKYYFNHLGRGFIDPYVVGACYMDGDTSFYGGLSVYNLYGFTDQLAEWYTLYNTKISGKKILGNQKIIFKRQREVFFYGGMTKKVGKSEYVIMSPERALIERLKEGVVFRTLPKSVDPKKLIALADQYASRTIQKKIQLLCL